MVKKVLVGLLVLAVYVSFAANYGYWYSLDGATYFPVLGRIYMMWSYPISKSAPYQGKLTIIVDMYGGITIMMLAENDSLDTYNKSTVTVSLYVSNTKYVLFTHKNIHFVKSGGVLASSSPLLTDYSTYVPNDSIVYFIRSMQSSDKIEVKITTASGKTYTYTYSPIGLNETISYLFLLSSYGF